MPLTLAKLRADIAEIAAKGPGPWRLRVYPATELPALIEAADSGDAQAGQLGVMFCEVSETLQSAPEHNPCVCLTCGTRFPQRMDHFRDWPATLALLSASEAMAGIALLSCWDCYSQRGQAQFLAGLRDAVCKLTEVDVEPVIVRNWRERLRLLQETPAGHA